MSENSGVTSDGAEKSSKTGEKHKGTDDNLDRKTLFVRSIPKSATDEELSEHFSQFVPVKHAVIVLDEEKKSRGFGFVSFTEEEDTLTALVESKKARFKGQLLRVDIARRRDRKNPENGEAPAKHEPEHVEKRKARLIVRNLPWSCNDGDKLKKVFLKFGAVHEAYVPAKKGGLMKGFGFVVMKKNAAAERAVQESAGLKIDGRLVSVDVALEKSKWEEAQAREGTGRERHSQASKDLVQTKPEDSDSGDEDDTDDSDNDSDEDDTEFDQLNNPEEEGDDEDEMDEGSGEARPKHNRQEAYSVFVRNIPYDADKESLQEHFSKFGAVKYALPVIDKVTGLAKGSAFVAFRLADAYDKCLENAPTASATSMLISDDVDPEYVYQGRILSISPTVDRNSATKLADRNSTQRGEVYGKSPADRDKRNLYLLNEGRITENSKLAQFVSKTDMELREKSYKLRVQQLNKNPTLHLSLTRLAVRNIPRSMTDKTLKALGRKAVVEFAKEVKDGKRQTLSKEEVNRSIKSKHEVDEETAAVEEKKKNKKKGVVRQAKVIMEVKSSGDVGRSRGYGFIEFRDHKAALMGLRWMNAHQVTMDELTEYMTEEQRQEARLDATNKRQLIVEFAVENAQVVKRRRERILVSRNKRAHEEDEEEAVEKDHKKQKRSKGPSKKGNMNKGSKKEKADGRNTEDKSDGKHTEDKGDGKHTKISDSVKHIIGRKRKGRKGK